MDRPTTRTEADSRGSRLDPDEALVLPSRRPALDLCRATAKGVGGVGGAQSGPMLVTGDAGVGKTWLWRRFAAESPPDRRWIAVDLTPSDDPGDFYRLIAHEVGLVDPCARHSSTSRVGLVDFLAGRQADGERISLVVEEAHNLSGDLWEEVRVLANRLDRPGGFASMILVGQTSLALRFSTRPFAAIEARLASRVHLGPIGVDEAKELLTRLRPGRDWADDEVETLHRDASGNPRRLLRLAGPRLAVLDEGMADRALEDPRSGERILTMAVESPPIQKPASVANVVGPAAIASPKPLIGPEKPPIRVEDNMIEVGWAPENTPSPDGRDEESSSSAAAQGGEEAVQDHYAALQAWREWSENQARRISRPPETFEDEPDEEIEVDDEDEPTTPLPPRVDRPTVRVEGEQKFAPFGQLFSRMAQAREPE